MAMIHAHVTQLYALVTSPHFEIAYSSEKFKYQEYVLKAWSISKQGVVYEIYYAHLKETKWSLIMLSE